MNVIPLIGVLVIIFLFFKLHTKISEKTRKKQSVLRQKNEAIFIDFLKNWSLHNELSFQENSRYPPDWHVRRQYVITRDKFACLACGKYLFTGKFINSNNWDEWLHSDNPEKIGYIVKGDVHHKKPLSQGGRHEFSNLILLCFECHSLQPDHSLLRDKLLSQKFNKLFEYSSRSFSNKRKAKKKYVCDVCSRNILSSDYYYFSKLGRRFNELRSCSNCHNKFFKR